MYAYTMNDAENGGISQNEKDIQQLDELQSLSKQIIESQDPRIDVLLLKMSQQTQNDMKEFINRSNNLWQFSLQKATQADLPLVGQVLTLLAEKWYQKINTLIIMWDDDLTSIDALDLTKCTNITSFTLNGKNVSSSPIFPNLEKLERLNISWTNIKTLDWSVGNLSKVKFLDISNNTKLQTLPDEIGKLTNVTHITLKNNLSLQKLPDSMKQLRGVTSLTINNCPTYFTGEGWKEQLCSFIDKMKLSVTPSETWLTIYPLEKSNELMTYILYKDITWYKTWENYSFTIQHLFNWDIPIDMPATVMENLTVQWGLPNLMEQKKIDAYIKQYEGMWKQIITQVYNKHWQEWANETFDKIKNKVTITQLMKLVQWTKNDKPYIPEKIMQDVSHPPFLAQLTLNHFGRDCDDTSLELYGYCKILGIPAVLVYTENHVCVAVPNANFPEDQKWCYITIDGQKYFMIETTKEADVWQQIFISWVTTWSTLQSKLKGDPSVTDKVNVYLWDEKWSQETKLNWTN